MKTDIFLPQNAFSSLVVDGLVKLNDVHIPLTCLRGTSEPATTLLVEECFARADGLPIRPSSELPPPADLCLHVSLQPERLGYGRVGSVYSISCEDPNGSSIPPLVMKVAARHRSENLAREAWFYEEMEHIQGVSIARCYGFFTAEIDPNSEVLNWAESDESYNPDENDDYLDEDDESEDANNSQAAEWSNTVAWNENCPPGTWGKWPEIKVREAKSPVDEDTTKKGPRIKPNRPDPVPSSDIKRTFVAVLLLERLGDMMPMGVSLESMKPDIAEIYSDIGELGIEQMDIRWRNILAAPSTREGLICPYHGHKHQWRVVDFDRARKSSLKKFCIDDGTASHLRRLLAGLTKGYVIEYWE